MQDNPTVITTSKTLQPPNGNANLEEKENEKFSKRRTSRVKSQSTERKKKMLMNRVPDETLNLEDTVFGINTSFLLVMIGLFKLFLVVPLFVLGIILVSMKSSGKRELLKPVTFSSAHYVTTSSALNETASTPRTATTELPPDARLFYQGNDSMAPLWTAAVLALAAGMDFFASFGRQGNTIIGYMLASTVSFVSCILCIEYDRLEISSINYLSMQSEYLDLHYNLYLSCIIFGAVGVAIGLLSIVVGTRMAALEQLRLYMERDGQKAVLHTDTSMIPRAIATIRQKLSFPFDSNEEMLEQEDIPLSPNESLNGYSDEDHRKVISN